MHDNEPLDAEDLRAEEETDEAVAHAVGSGQRLLPALVTILAQ